MEIEAITDTPAAKPSKPSIRFTVLVNPTIQKIVTGTANHSGMIKMVPKGLVTHSICTPKTTGMAAAIIWPVSFTLAGIFLMSSQIPKHTIAVAPNKKPKNSLYTGMEKRTAAINPINMANPPRRGII